MLGCLNDVIGVLCCIVSQNELSGRWRVLLVRTLPQDVRNLPEQCRTM